MVGRQRTKESNLCKREVSEYSYMKLFLEIIKSIFTALVTVAILLGILFGVTRLLAHRNTLYAENFNQQAFKFILVGISMEDVQQMVGQPLNISKTDAGFEYHTYSTRKKDGDYYLKLIIYQNGRVADVHESYYVD